MGMFTNIRQYAYDRRRGIAVLTGVAGGLYMAGKYMLSRLEEMRESVAIERNARDSLRRRFGQNQSDVSFTVLALLPSVGHRILDSMNVERVTLELRSLGAPASKAGSAPSTSAGASAAPTPAPYSVPLPQTPVAVSDDARSESSEMPGSYSNGDPMAESSSSWVDQFNASQLAESNAESLGMANLGDSVAALSVTSEEPSAASLASSMLSDSSRAPSRTSDAPEAPTRSKSELWRDLKILSVTRALTLAYTTTLLTLLTTTQLTLLGRLKYIRAVHEAASERPTAPRPADGPSSIITDFASSFFGSSAKGAGEETELEPDLSEDEERRFLSLSWWLLHDGWRVVAHRVQTAVEGIFEGVSLKTQLSVDDLIVLVRSVHNAIDLSDNFAAAILPPEEHLSRILTLADPTASPPASHPAASLPDIPGSGYQQRPALHVASTRTLLAELLDETQARIRGADFALVLQAALTRAEGSLLEGIDAEMFAPLRAAELNKDEEAALQGAFGPPRVREIPEPRARLAALLPAVARWAHTVVGSGYPNDVVENLTRLREVEVYSAIVYGAYDDSLGR